MFENATRLTGEDGANMGTFMMNKTMKMMFLAVCCLWAAPVFAVSVSLNGVNVDGITGQRFENCTVVVDDVGNINIVAAGYGVKRGQKDGVVAGANVQAVIPGAPPTRRYWVVSEKPAPGQAQYELRLFVNKKWIRTFFPVESGTSFELTKYLKTGPNNIRIEADKKIGAKGRASSSPKHYVRLVFGEGHLEGPSVVITRNLLDYRRTALETKDFKTSKVLMVR